MSHPSHTPNYSQTWLHVLAWWHARWVCEQADATLNQNRQLATVTLLARWPLLKAPNPEQINPSINPLQFKTFAVA